MPTTVRPMAPDRLSSWIGVSQADYADSLLQAGESPEQAAAHAQQSTDESFPGGVPRENHHVYDVVADGEVVGYLWIGPQNGGDLTAWWVWDIGIDEPHRGRGFGRAAMTLAEEQARLHGATALGLNVFAYNTAARGLYASLGYEVRSMRMFKAL